MSELSSINNIIRDKYSAYCATFIYNDKMNNVKHMNIETKI